MTKKHKIFLYISLSEIFIAVAIIIFFLLPCNKAVTWDANNGDIISTNTKGRTNFSQQINSELDQFTQRWVYPNLKTPRELPECSYRPLVNYRIISNTSNLCIVRIKAEIYETNLDVPDNQIRRVSEIGEEVFDYYIYVDSKAKTIMTKFVLVTDTYAEND